MGGAGVHVMLHEYTEEEVANEKGKEENGMIKTSKGEARKHT